MISQTRARALGATLGLGLATGVVLAFDAGGGVAVLTLAALHVVGGLVAARLVAGILMRRARLSVLALVLTGLGCGAAGLVGLVGTYAHVAAAVVVLALVAIRTGLPKRAGILGALGAVALVAVGYTLAITLTARSRPKAFSRSEITLAGAQRLEPGALAGSTSCGGAGCHQAIVTQWEASAHSQAGTDVFFRFAADKMAEDYDARTTQLCASCHEPGAVVSGAVRRGEVDAASRREGVSCLACHLITDVADTAPHGVPANASFTITPVAGFLASPPKALAPLLAQRHGRLMRRPLLRTDRFCAACHQFFVPPEPGGKAGRLRLQIAEAHASMPTAPLTGAACGGCHMRLVAADDPSRRDGMVHDHRTLGSNLLLPTLAGDTAQLEATLAFRRAGGVSLELGAPIVGASGHVAVPVTVRNPGIGHDFPTGATDISEAWVELTLSDDGGKVVFRSPGLDAERYLDPKAPGLGTTMLLAAGESDFLHDLFAQKAPLKHVRVHAGGTERLDVDVMVPAGSPRRLKAHAVLRHRHGNERWNAWVFNWTPVEVPVFDVAVADRVIDLPTAVTEVAIPPLGRAAITEPGMIGIAGGVVLIGADADDALAEPEEGPAHPVVVAAFAIDKAPVTHADYERQVALGKVVALPTMREPGYAEHSWIGGHPPERLRNHPVVLVTAKEAESYCQAVGKRLPTEIEWEAAARAGAPRRRYAWGDTFDAGRCNTSESGRHGTVPVGSWPASATALGVLDLGCNVSEWVATVYTAYPRLRLDNNRADWIDHFSLDARAIRGGSFLLSSAFSRVTARSFENDAVRKIIGFRCARSLEEAPR